MTMKLWPRFFYALFLLLTLTVPGTLSVKESTSEAKIQVEYKSVFSHFRNGEKESFENSVSVDSLHLPFLGLLEFTPELLCQLNYFNPEFEARTNYFQYPTGPSPPDLLS